MWGNFFFFVNEKPQAVSGKRSLFFYPQQGKECFTYAAILRGLANVNPKLADNCGDSGWRKAAHASRQFWVSRVGTRRRPRAWEAPLLSPSSSAQRGAATWMAIGRPQQFSVSGYFRRFGATLTSVWEREWISLYKMLGGVLEKFPIPLEQSRWCSKFGENCKVANGSKEGV